MAELLGAIASGITLVGLFKACIDAFDVIQNIRHHDSDYQRLAVRLEIEKARLYTWGEVMGLTDLPEGDRKSPLANHKFEDLIRKTLETIFLLFNDSDRLRDAYGCKARVPRTFLPTVIESDSIEKLGSAFNRFRIRVSPSDKVPSRLQKAKWAIHDHKKFVSLITELQTFIDGLKQITEPINSVSRQSDLIIKAIKGISDVRTHLLLADACREDYPEISEISSRASEIASMLTDDIETINQWKLTVEAANATDQTVGELESMTVTELKHRVLQLVQESKPDHVSDLSNKDRSVRTYSPFPPRPAPEDILVAARRHERGLIAVDHFYEDLQTRHQQGVNDYHGTTQVCQEVQPTQINQNLTNSVHACQQSPVFACESNLIDSSWEFSFPPPWISASFGVLRRPA